MNIFVTAHLLFVELQGCHMQVEGQLYSVFTVVQCIVGCILYNKHIVWPWTVCVPFVYSSECSIDFDWLQVHINTEQELQYRRKKRTSLWDAGYSTVKIGVQGGGGTKTMQRAKQSIISDQLWATMIEHVFIRQKTMTEKYEIWLRCTSPWEVCFEQRVFYCLVYCLLTAWLCITSWSLCFWFESSVWIWAQVNLC